MSMRSTAKAPSVKAPPVGICLERSKDPDWEHCKRYGGCIVCDNIARARKHMLENSSSFDRLAVDSGTSDAPSKKKAKLDGLDPAIQR
jgi:hypothetical protein